MDEYLQLVSNVFATSTSPSSEAFAQLVLLSAQTHTALQCSLKESHSQQRDASALTKSIQNASINRIDGPIAQKLGAVLSALLDYVAHCPPIQDLINPADKTQIQWKQRYAQFVWQDAQNRWGILFNCASSLFGLSTSSPVYFFSSFRYISSSFLTLCIRLDVLSGQAIKFPKVTDCTARLAGPVRASGMDRTPLDGSKTRRGAAMWLGNDCLRGYFRLNNLKLCETVLKSIREAINRNRDFASNAETATGEEPYPMAERVKYRYYVGRIRISQGRVREGFSHLQWAFEHCPVSATAQLRRILSHLLPLALVLGMRPRSHLVEILCPPESDIGQLYLPLFRAYAKPDIALFEQLMDERPRKERLRKLGVHLLIQEKCIAPMWRGIIKRCLLLTLPSTPANPNAPPTLTLPLLLKGARFALGQLSDHGQAHSRPDAVGDDEISRIRDIDVECIVASLIDQGYIKGYTFHSKKLLVFQKGPSLGFPRVSDVY